MGFRPYATEFVLDLSGTRYEGAEVLLRADISLRERLDLMETVAEGKGRIGELQEIFRRGDEAAAKGEERDEAGIVADAARARELQDQGVDVIDAQWAWMLNHGIFRRWDLERDDGTPIPFDAREELPAPLVVQIANRWFQNMSDPLGPFERRSPAGGT